jgi:hypothetical protein
MQDTRSVGGINRSDRLALVISTAMDAGNRGNNPLRSTPPLMAAE